MSSIAIIGLGCSFPGAEDPKAFWKLLIEEGDAIERVPPTRWDADAFYDPDPGAPEKTNSRWGGFIRDIDRFDAAFFGIAPEEATRMDPQQKLFLRVAYTALENAGVSVKDASGSETGVFAGVSHSDHEQKLKRDRPSIDANLGVHSYHCFSANRVSYHLNLRGPSLAVDSACSSSLVAIHLACRSLRDGECDVAIAGGVNAHLAPEESISTSMMGLLSEDGRCRSFSDRAEGFARSEGCGVVVLKRLEDALAQGDPILAVIRGSAMNHNGASNGITAPNGPAQERVIARALERSGVEGAAIQYVEAHGTGTAVGDQVEAAATQEVLGVGREAGSVCLMGCVKTNIGHLEAGAGVAGLIKVVLALHHEVIPRHLHFSALNPAIDLDPQRFRIVTEATPWPRTAGVPRLASVSAFSFGGTNCHMIVEEPPPRAVAAEEAPSVVLSLSAKTRESLVALVEETRRFLLASKSERLVDIAHSMNVGRASYPYRSAFVGRSAADLALRLESQSVASSRAGRRAPRFGLACGPDAAHAGQLARAVRRIFPVLAARFDEEIELELARAGEVGRDGRFLDTLLVVYVLRAMDIHPSSLVGGAGHIECLGDYAGGRVSMATVIERAAPSWGLGVQDGAAVIAVDVATGRKVAEGSSDLTADLRRNATDVAAFFAIGLRARGASLDGVVVFGLSDDEEAAGLELLGLIGWFWTQGGAVDWKRIYPSGQRLFVPNYPFQKQMSWFVPSSARGVDGVQS